MALGTRSADGGATWDPLTTDCISITFVLTRPELVICGGYSGVYGSRNLSTWHTIGTQYPQRGDLAAAAFVVVPPRRPTTIYVGTNQSGLLVLAPNGA